MTPHVGKWWRILPDRRIECDLCPRLCKLHDGQRGHCFVRERVGDELILSTYGRSFGFQIDPIEKKPLHHFHPGSSVLSFGTAGCNLACRFCQNWDISKSRDMERLTEKGTPEEIAQAAVQSGCKSVAFTYNDPVVFAEYAMDAADACHEKGVQTVAVTAGYICPEPRAEFFAKMDGANVDLKAFTEGFYSRVCGGHLGPVLETLAYVKRETSCWLEITTLLIEGENDSDRELNEVAEWVMKELGPDVPIHFSAAHPAFRMTDIPPTSLKTLQRACGIARRAGLRYVYTGNLHDPEGETTFCPGCGKRVVERDGYRILRCEVTGDGTCPSCGGKIPGRWGGG
jgi:pyruvate formate lyase activating enzyme